MSAQRNYELLIEKLDRFIRRYYVNQLIRGSLYSIGLLGGLFIAFSVAEYHFYFPSEVRKVLFWSYLGVSAAALGYWVGLPLLHYFRLGKVISHEQAAMIIGRHFSDVQDKLLNILQLRNQVDSAASKELILASIEQKSEQIKLVPFQKAIDLSQNRKYLRYALPPLLLLLLILLVNASLITDSTRRIIQNDREFEKPAPFHFLVPQEKLQVVQYEDFPLTVKVEGSVLPAEVFVEVDGYPYRMRKQDAHTFTWRFRNVQQDTRFRIFAGRVSSPEYTLEVLRKPGIAGFEVRLDYPAYTGRRDETLQSIGDLVVPAGTVIDWVFEARWTDQIALQFEQEPEPAFAKRFDDELFSFRKKALRTQAYKLYVSNADLPRADSVSYVLSVIPDQYPSISVEAFKDSTIRDIVYFVGEATDDYGLRRLTFNYRITRANGGEEPLQTIEVSKPTDRAIQYAWTWDLAELGLQPGDEVSYYFEVWDNDQVNGSKASRTPLMTHAMPTREELEARAEANDDKIKEELRRSLEESKKVQEDLKKLRERMLQEKEVDWQMRKELERLLNRHKELQQRIEEARKAFEENRQQQEQFENTDESTQEKQEQLQELFEEVMDEKTEELLRQIEELMDKLEKEGALDMLEQMEFTDQEMEMELERLLELFKELEVEHEINKAIEKLEELAEQQEQLSEQTRQTPEGDEQKQQELQQKQQEINEQFEKLEEQIKELKKKNEELERPKDLGNPEEQMEDIEQDLNDSQQQLQQQQNRKAAQKQKSAAQKMREMAQQMASQMQAQAMQQMQEDMESLRQLLENLVSLSFEQEDLMTRFAEATPNTPHYVALTQEQFRIKDDFRIVEDSLQALAKRVFQIESYVTEKVTEARQHLARTIDELEERRTPPAMEHQQRVMKNLNDLALMLSEVMEQMQQQMAGMMAGAQMCTKPGGAGKDGNVPMDKITQGQKELGEQMKQMRQRMQNGQGGTSEEFARMAARQAALREALRQKQKQLQEQGKGSKELQKLIEEMDRIETDLVNKRLTNEMLRRQQEILTRLLEAERAEREREYDNKRQAETARAHERKLPPSLEEYLRKREAEIEEFRTVSPALRPYYRTLVEQYFRQLKEKGRG